MLQKLQDLLKFYLDKLNFLDKDQRISLTNITVAAFVGICAVRMLLGGSSIDVHYFKWAVQPIDTAGTLPVLFSLLNYSHKRQMINNNSNGGNNTTNA